MSKVFHDEEWKRNPIVKREGPTRAQEQARINYEFATGKMSTEKWREKSVELSEPTKWTAAGRVTS